MISFHNVSRNFEDTVALCEVNLTLGTNQVTGLLGLNGAGKTTLLRLLTGALAPTTGEVRIGPDGDAPHTLSAKRLIGYLPDHPPLFDDMWVQEALQYKARLHGLSGPEHHQHLLGLVERLGLRESLLRPIHTLSKGLRQRVALAQTLLHDPSIVILDEPTSGLDPQQTADIRALIVDLSSHATVIVATHNLHEVETLCDSVVILVQGKVALSKPLSEVLAQGHSLAQRFQSVHDDQRVQG